MVNEYLIVNDSQYKIKILVDTDSLDYYTDIILQICIGKKKIELIRDNVIFLVNQIRNCIERIKYFTLDGRLNEDELGLLLNEYYYYMNEEKISDKIILDTQGKWIGEQYCCFVSPVYSTWIYLKDNKINMKISPIFQFFDEDNNYEHYKKFKKEYSDIYNTPITFQQLNKMFEILSSLYESIKKINCGDSNKDIHRNQN